MSIHTDKAIWEAETEGLELLDLTIGGLLDRQAEAFFDREALVYNYPGIGLDLRLTHRQYRDVTTLVMMKEYRRQAVD